MGQQQKLKDAAREVAILYILCELSGALLGDAQHYAKAEYYKAPQKT
jgi:hypothetical protein